MVRGSGLAMVEGNKVDMIRKKVTCLGSEKPSFWKIRSEKGDEIGRTGDPNCTVRGCV